MLFFNDARDSERASLFVKLLCFADEGNEYYGLRTIEITHAEGPKDRNLIIGHQGSCSLIKYQSRHFAVFTRHQIASVGEESREQFSARMSLLYVLIDDGNDATNLPIKALITPILHSDDADCSDFVIALVEPTMISPFMDDQFFPVDERHFGSVGSFALAIGFAGHEQRMLMEIGGLRTLVGCKSGKIVRHQNGATATMTYPIDRASMEGYSGGAVIAVGANISERSSSQFVAHFNGLIQRAGNGFVHYLTTERILLEIDLAIATGSI